MNENPLRLMVREESVVDWLLGGDPAIRWQVMRDLLDESVEVWERERRSTVESGWVAELLARQGADGEWPAGRWTASTWTLLLLVALGIPHGHPAGRAPIERLLDKFVPEGASIESLLKRVDLCHLGFWLGLGAHFLDDDPRLALLGETVLSAQFEDGGWNCRKRNHPDTVHSSFHTTFNMLENLRIAAARGIVTRRSFAAAERRAVELLLEHRLYRSDRTGKVISERFTQLTFPWHWHYTFLRGLDYLHLTPAISDHRLADPIDMLREKRKPNGRWSLQKRIPGTLLVEMEKPGQDSRWNTLTALRVLRQRNDATSR
jgi:hypothetical protein